MSRGESFSKLEPLGIELDGIRVNGHLYHEVKERAGWGNGGGLDASKLNREEQDFAGIHGEPLPPTDGWVSADILLDTVEGVLEPPEYAEPSDGKRIELDAALVAALAAIGSERSGS